MGAWSATDDDVLAAAAGDRQAFVRLVTASANMVTGIAVAIGRDVQASQDIAQEVFLVAWRDIGKLRNPSSFLPWLRQITRNHAHQWLRDQQLGRRVRDAEGVLATVVDAAPAPPDVLEGEDRRRLVREVVDALPDDAREVITLYYKEGRSVRQVADLLALAEPTVRKRLSRARAAIREELLERFAAEVGRSAPASAVALAVGGALGAAAPSAAAGGSLTAAKLAGGSVVAKLAGALGGGLLGAVLSSAAIRFGIRRELERAMDERERRELLRFGRVAGWAVVAATVGIALAAVLESAALLVGVQVAFLSSLSWLYMVRMPRITARRRAAEVARDPSAAARHHRDRRKAWLGLLVGATVSTATVVFAVFVLLAR